MESLCPRAISNVFGEQSFEWQNSDNYFPPANISASESEWQRSVRLAVTWILLFIFIGVLAFALTKLLPVFNRYVREQDWCGRAKRKLRGWTKKQESPSTAASGSCDDATAYGIPVLGIHLPPAYDAQDVELPDMPPRAADWAYATRTDRAPPEGPEGDEYELPAYDGFYYTYNGIQYAAGPPPHPEAEANIDAAPRPPSPDRPMPARLRGWSAPPATSGASTPPMPTIRRIPPSDSGEEWVEAVSVSSDASTVVTTADADTANPGASAASMAGDDAPVLVPEQIPKQKKPRRRNAARSVPRRSSGYSAIARLPDLVNGPCEAQTCDAECRVR